MTTVAEHTLLTHWSSDLNLEICTFPSNPGGTWPRGFAIGLGHVERALLLHSYKMPSAEFMVLDVPNGGHWRSLAKQIRSQCRRKSHVRSS